MTTRPGEFPFAAPASKPQNGPPAETEVSAGALFRALTDMVRAHEVLPFPRVNDDGQAVGDYWLQILTQSEIDDATIDAEKYIRRRAKERSQALGESAEQAAERPNQEAWRDMFESALQVELVWRSARRKDEPRFPLFAAPDDIRKHCTPNEITSIVNSYDQIQRRFGPLFRKLSDDDLEQWLVRLTEGGAEALPPFGLLSPGELAQLIASMAERWPTSPTGRFLLGSQSVAGTASIASPPVDPTAEMVAAEPEFRAE